MISDWGGGQGTHNLWYPLPPPPPINILPDLAFPRE